MHNQESDKSSLIASLRSQIEAANQTCNEHMFQYMHDDMHRVEDRK